MVKKNKQIIKQVIIILLLVIPLIIIISVSAVVVEQYRKKLKLEWVIESRPSIPQVNFQDDFEVKPINNDPMNDDKIVWENTGQNIEDRSSSTFAFLQEYPQLKNNGIVKKVYEIKLKENIRARDDLLVALQLLSNYNIYKTGSNQKEEPGKTYIKLADGSDSVQFYLKRDVQANGQIIWEPLQLNKNSRNDEYVCNTELIKGGPQSVDSKPLITENELKNNLSKIDDFKKQYLPSNTIKLVISFKINQAQMEQDGIWNQNNGPIKLSAELELYTIAKNSKINN